MFQMTGIIKFAKNGEKKELLCDRKAEMIKVKARGMIDKIEQKTSDVEMVHYKAHIQYLIEQKGHLYLEEEVEGASKGRIL